MKRNIILEQIIRKALLENEGANITVETAVLNTREDAEMDAFHKLVLEPSKLKDITYDKADGTAVMITRSFGRGEDKKFYLSPEDLKKYAILKLDSLSAGLQAKTSTDYVWILDMQDTKLDKRDKPKEKRIFATYRFPAFYINKSLIGKSLTATTSGYIQTIGRGAMLFDRAKIKDSEWKRVASVGIDEPTKIGDATTIVKSNLEFGTNSGSVPQLFKYFFTKASAVIDNAASVKNSTKFGCELRGACEQFQTEQNLPVTGKWDDASIKRASELYAKQIPVLKPEEAPAPEYIFSDTTKLKELIAACKIETAATSSVTPSVTYKFNVTKDDAGLIEVQKLMLAWLREQGIEKAKKENALRKSYEKLKNAIDGKKVSTYGPTTKEVVAGCKAVLKQLGKDIDSDSELIDSKFIDLIK